MWLETSGVFFSFPQDVAHVCNYCFPITSFKRCEEAHKRQKGAELCGSKEEKLWRLEARKDLEILAL
jgi:hypothetical protein